MPRSHGRIQVTIWADEDFRALSSSAQRAYLMLLSQAQINNCGVLPYIPRKWARMAPDTPLETLTGSLWELDAERFIVIDDESQELLVRTFIRHDRIEQQPNLKKAAQREFREIESERIKQVLADEFPQLFEWRGQQRSLFQPETEGVREPLPEGVSEGVPEGVSARTRARSRDRTAAPPAPTPTPSSAYGSSNGPVARGERAEARYRELPEEKQRLAEKLLQAIGDHADAETEHVVRSYAVGLSEGALAKVLESLKAASPDNRAGYAVAALASERREAAA